MTANILRRAFGLVVSFSLLTVLCEAQLPYAKFSYFSNTGGVNDNLSATEIQDNEATDIQNFVFDSGGALTKRFGYVSVGTSGTIRVGSATSVNGLCFYKKDNGNKFLVAITNNGGTPFVYKKSYTSGTLSTKRWDLIYIASHGIGSAEFYSANYHPSFAVASDWVVFTTGYNVGKGGVTGNDFKPMKWTGNATASVLSSSANLPQATLVCYHKNILFLSGNSVFPSRVYFSNVGDIATYTATDFFDVASDDGTIIHGLISAFDCLYIFKDNSIYRLSGSNRDDVILELMVRNIGTLANNSISIAGNLIYFTTSQGDICAYDGGYGIVFISNKIRNTISSMDFTRTKDVQGLAFSSYRNNDYDYYTTTSGLGASKNNKVLMFDTFHKAWTKIDGIQANAWCVGDDDSGKNAMYFGDYSGQVHRYPSSTYYDGYAGASTAVSAFYQTKWFKYSDVALGNKYWRLLKTYALSSDSATLTADCRSDYEASGKTVTMDLDANFAQWDVGSWDSDLWGGSTVIIGRHEINKGKNMFQIKYSNAELNKSIVILGFENFIEKTDAL